jgi:hypothetical protein
VIAEFRTLLIEKEDSNRLADLLEKQAPNCGCEAVSVGQGSPGPVLPEELLHRILSSPRDYDPISGKISEQPFRKAFQTGLSVWRAIGPEKDITALMEEGLSRRADEPVKSIYGVLEASASDIKQITNSAGAICFCIYDQTVTRMKSELPPVPTHAGIFQRLPPPGTADRTNLQKDIAGKLRELFEKTLMSAQTYRNGICVELNRRSNEGEFIR